MNWKIILAFAMISYGLPALATHSNDDDGRYISVTGSAEVSVQPDEIELEIILKEFGKEKSLVKLDVLERDFHRILKENGIDKSSIVFNTSGYYWYYWWTYRHEYHKQKRFTVKLDKSTDFLSLMKDLDTEGIASIRISNTTNSSLQELRREVKIKAVQAAREKADYLLESIGEKVGHVISIEEVADHSNRHYWGRNSNQLSNVVVSGEASGNEIENLSRIKLRYEITAKFEIE